MIDDEPAHVTEAMRSNFSPRADYHYFRVDPARQIYDFLFGHSTRQADLSGPPSASQPFVDFLSNILLQLAR